MKVLLVAEQLRRAVPGGIGTYIRGLVQGLGSIESENLKVELFASRAEPDPLASLGFPIQTSPVPSQVLTRLWDWGLNDIETDAEIVHAASLVTPPARKSHLITTVHDLAWRRTPRTFPTRGSRWHERALVRAVERSSLLITPSSDTANELTVMGAKKVEVIEEGSNHLPPPDTSGAQALLKKLNVQSPFILSVSTIEPRKNLPRLLSAYQKIRPKLPEPWPLLIVGPHGWGKDIEAPEGVEKTGEVSEGVLAGLYSLAHCVAYVPLYEGFGLPPLEAMHAGVPVVASAIPSVAEAAFIVDPLSEESIAEGLLQVSIDNELREFLKKSGSERAEHLRWENVAKRHIELWESLL